MTTRKLVTIPSALRLRADEIFADTAAGREYIANAQEVAQAHRDNTRRAHGRSVWS